MFINTTKQYNFVNITKLKTYHDPYIYFCFKEKLEEGSISKIFFKLFDTPETYKDTHKRYFSCAEKKLQAIKNIKTIYITKIPCYLCLPMINSRFTYIDNRIIYYAACIKTTKLNQNYLYKKEFKLLYKI